MARRDRNIIQRIDQRTNPMKRIIPAVLALVIAWPLLTPSSAAAQDLPKNPRMVIKYVEPTLVPVHERLKRRKVLEELSQFLSPLQLKQPLTVTTAQCDMINAFYNPGNRTVTMCYEMAKFIDEIVGLFVERKLHFDKRTKRMTLAASRDTIQLKPRIPGITRAEAVVGGFLSILLHEMGHAIFHIQQIPVLGREEDAADQVAGFIMVQFGKDVALTAIKGAATLWDLYSQVESQVGFPYYDEHSASLQRLATFLCIGYGSDKATFQGLVNAGLLPKSRAENCEREYEEVRAAFRETILRDVNAELMEKVRARRWLRPEELTRLD
jgi:hypothetical protein